MHTESPEAFKKHINGYLAVFGVLMLGTLLTVWASSWKVAVPAAIVIALAIASVKAGLVAAYFMHLKGEKPAIWWCLLLAGVLFFVLILTPTLLMLLTMSRNAG